MRFLKDDPPTKQSVFFNLKSRDERRTGKNQFLKDEQKTKSPDEKRRKDQNGDSPEKTNENSPENIYMPSRAYISAIYSPVCICYKPFICYI